MTSLNVMTKQSIFQAYKKENYKYLKKGLVVALLIKLKLLLYFSKKAAR